MTGVSVVVPAYNEEENISLIEAELLPIAQAIGAEVILVDDGSDDRTADLAEKAPGLRLLKLPRSGKSIALRSGFEVAVGEIVVTIDADLQEDPTLMESLVQDVREGAALSMGIRVYRADRLLAKRFPSRIYRILIALMFFRDFRDIDCGFRAFRREEALALPWFAGSYRLIPLFFHRRGGRIVERQVDHRERRFGESKYMSPQRFVSGLRDLIKVRLSP